MPDPTNPTLHSDLATARYQRVESLFFAASDLPPADRQAFLNAQCGADTTLLLELESLLESDSSVSGLMATTPPPAEEDPWLNRTLGGYQIVELLGRGGMGVVYLGTRTAQGLSQKVAIKLIARHLQSTPAQTQFLLERDTLADLHHPNIARLLDGGLTPEGLPFVVMDYIEGQRLDTLADDPRTTLPQIASLIIQLCHAVGYTHRNLILHRDLKPGNVLVTPGGPRDEGVVKLLDFGTLKSLDPSLRRDSAMTEAGMRSLTLRYASPEHIRGDPPSTSMDVYSLGMTLYRLLAGRLPEADTDLTLPEQLRRLETRTPLAPSASMRTARRRLDAALTADLDAIALHAIRFDPADRYPSADALAEDLQRALDRQPVLARAGTVRYRAARFFARNRTLVLGAAAALLVLAIGLPVMAHEATLANAQTARAQVGVEDERKLAHTLLFDYFEQLKAIPGSTDPQRRTVTQAVNFLDSLSSINTNKDPQLEADAVEAYTRMGELLGSPYEENLGEIPAAIAALTKAVDLSQQLNHDHPGVPAYKRAGINAKLSISGIYFADGELQNAIRLAQAASDDALLIIRQPQAPITVISLGASASDRLGDIYDMPRTNSLLDQPRADAAYKQAIALDKMALARDPSCTRCQRGIALELWKLGAINEDDDPETAAADFRLALTDLDAMVPEEKKTSRVIRMHNLIQQHLGNTQYRMGQLTDGIQNLSEIQKRFQLAIQNDPIDIRAHFDLYALDFDLANAYDDMHRLDLEEQTVRERLEVTTFLAHADPENPAVENHLAEALIQTAAVEEKLHHTDLAARERQQGLALAQKLAESPNASPEALFFIAAALLRLPSAMGSTNQASDDVRPQVDRATGEKAIVFVRRALTITPKPTALQLLTYANAQIAVGDLRGAADAAQRALKLMPPNPKNLYVISEQTEARAMLRLPH